MTSWRQENGEVQRIERVVLDDLAARIDEDPELQLLDVREKSEWAAGHIPGSAVAPWHDIRSMPDGVDPEKPVAAVCASGQRAGTAVSLVQHYGGRQVIHVVEGGVPEWGRLGHPIEG